MVREVSPPSQRYGLQPASRIPIASSSRHPYAKAAARPASKRPILGERPDNISIKPRVLKSKARTSPKKPVAIVTRTSNTSSPASSISTAYASPRKRLSLSMKTRVFRYDADELLLDMEPPESLASMSSPGSMISNTPVRSKPIMGNGRMMTPADSQELFGEGRRSKTPTANRITSRQLNRLPTPPPSQSNEYTSAPIVKTSRMHPRPAPTPPRQMIREQLGSPTLDPSPNPRQKKTARVSILSPSRPMVASTPRPLLTSLSRLTGGPSTPSYATQSSLAIRDRVIPSTAPPPRRPRSSTVSTNKKPAAKPRKSMPEQTKQSNPNRARNSLTPDAIMAMTGRPIGFLKVKIEAEPGDDPLLLKGPDEEGYLRQRELSRSQSGTPAPDGKRAQLDRATSSQPRPVAGPSRLREVANYESPASVSSRRSDVQPSTPIRKSPARDATKEPQKEDVPAHDGFDFGDNDMQYEAPADWGSDNDTDIEEDEAIGAGKTVEEDFHLRETTLAVECDISPGPLPESSPAWMSRTPELSLSASPLPKKSSRSDINGEAAVITTTVPHSEPVSSPVPPMEQSSHTPSTSPRSRHQLFWRASVQPTSPSPTPTKRALSTQQTLRSSPRTTPVRYATPTTSRALISGPTPSSPVATPVSGASATPVVSRLLPARPATPYARGVSQEEETPSTSVPPSSPDVGDVTEEAIAADWNVQDDAADASVHVEREQTVDVLQETLSEKTEVVLEESDRTVGAMSGNPVEMPSSPSSAGDETVEAIPADWDEPAEEITRTDCDVTTAFNLPREDMESPLLAQVPLFCPASPSSSFGDVEGDGRDDLEAAVVEGGIAFCEPEVEAESVHVAMASIVEVVEEEATISNAPPSSPPAPGHFDVEALSPSWSSDESFAGDETQEAISSQWDISIDHASPVFADHESNFGVDSPETGSPLAEDIDFRREESLEAEAREVLSVPVEVSTTIGTRDEQTDVTIGRREAPHENIVIGQEAIAAFDEFISVPPSPPHVEESPSQKEDVVVGREEVAVTAASTQAEAMQEEGTAFGEVVHEQQTKVALVADLTPAIPPKSLIVTPAAISEDHPSGGATDLLQLIAGDFEDDSADDIAPHLEETVAHHESFNSRLSVHVTAATEIIATEEEEEFNSRGPFGSPGTEKDDIPAEQEESTSYFESLPTAGIHATEEEEEFNSSLPAVSSATNDIRATEEEEEFNSRLPSAPEVLAPGVEEMYAPEAADTVGLTHGDDPVMEESPIAVDEVEEADITVEGNKEDWDISSGDLEPLISTNEPATIEVMAEDESEEVEERDISVPVVTASSASRVEIQPAVEIIQGNEPEIEEQLIEYPAPSQTEAILPLLLAPNDHLQETSTQDEDVPEQVEVEVELPQKVSSRILLRVIERGVVKVEPEDRSPGPEIAEEEAASTEEQVSEAEVSDVHGETEEVQTHFGPVGDKVFEQIKEPTSRDQGEEQVEEAEEVEDLACEQEDADARDGSSPSKEEDFVSDDQGAVSEATKDLSDTISANSAITQTEHMAEAVAVAIEQSSPEEIITQNVSLLDSEDTAVAVPTHLLSTSQCAPSVHRFANAQSRGISTLESMLVRRQSASFSSTSTRPSRLSVVASAVDSGSPEQIRADHSDSSSSSEEQSSSSASINIRPSRARQSLADELATATAAEEDAGNESFRSVVEVSSLDPRAAARAAAILKLNHAYIEHGVLPSSTPAPSTSSVPLPATPSASSHLKTPRSARRRAYESRHFKTAESARKLGREELLYEAELEIVASKHSRSRSLGASEAGWESDETELAVPGGWKVTPGKRKRSRSIHSRSRPDVPVTPAVTAKGKEVSRADTAWGVGDWKRLEKVFRSEKEAWMKEREVKPLPGLFGWARKALGGGSEAKVKEWDNNRVVLAFLDREEAHGRSGEWAEKMILLRVKALEKRVNTTREEKFSEETDRGNKKQKVESKRREPVSTPGRGEDEEGNSTVVSIVPPSTIRRMLGYVWRPSDMTLDSIDCGDLEESPVKSTNARAEVVAKETDMARPVENKLLTRLKEIRDTPVKTPPSTSTMTTAPVYDLSTPMKQVTPSTPVAATPAHPSSPAWSPALPGKWTFTSASANPSTLRQQSTPGGTSSAPASSGLGLASASASSSSLPSITTSTPKLYPALNPPMAQRSSALKALFDTPQSGRTAPAKRLTNSPSVSDLVRSFEEDGVLGKNLEREGLKRSQSRV